MRTSFSALETFLQCPLKYKFQEIDRIRIPKSGETFFGSAIHNVLKFIHTSGVSTIPALPDAIAYFESKWNKDVFKDSFQEQNFFNQGKQLIEKYFKENDIAAKNVIATEMRFETPIDDHIMAGNIDRIDKLEDKSFEIIDYKTSRWLPSQDAVDNNLQLSIYQMGFLSRWPNFNEKIKVSLYFLQHGIKLSSVKTIDDIQKTKEKILKIIANIEKTKEENNFQPIPSALCDWCGYQKDCPMFSHKFRSKETILSDDEINIQKTLKDFFMLKETEQENKKVLAKLKERINRYCDEQKIERIFSDDGFAISRNIQKRYDYDWEKVAEILKKASAWETVFSPDKAKLEKIMPTLSPAEFQEIEKTKRLEGEFKVLRIEKR